jgi:ABC-type dipeptide/oligopeptide/nickel transport system permease subunit
MQQNTHDISTESVSQVDLDRRLSEAPGLFTFLRRLYRHRLSVIGTIIIVLTVLIALFAPVLAPYNPTKTDMRSTLQGPSIKHLLGTDHLGRDALSRVLYGSRISLLVGVLATALAATMGTLLGLTAGYFGGKVDALIMRITDTFMCFPAFIFTITLAAALGPGIRNLIIAIGVHAWTSYCRLIRGQVLSVRQREFVEAAKSVGATRPRIVFRHIFPNSLAPIIVATSLSIGGGIMTEAAASFLGIGVKPPTPSWGIELRLGYPHLTDLPLLSMVPGLLISALVLAFNFLGDGLRDVLDPRMKGRY